MPWNYCTGLLTWSYNKLSVHRSICLLMAMLVMKGLHVLVLFCGTCKAPPLFFIYYLLEQHNADCGEGRACCFWEKRPAQGEAERNTYINVPGGDENHGQDSRRKTIMMEGYPTTLGQMQEKTTLWKRLYMCSTRNMMWSNQRTSFARDGMNWTIENRIRCGKYANF